MIILTDGIWFKTQSKKKPEETHNMEVNVFAIWGKESGKTVDAYSVKSGTISSDCCRLYRISLEMLNSA